MFDALPDPVLLVEDTLIVRTNDAARTMLGQGHVLAGQTLKKILPDNVLDRFRLLDAQRAQGWPLPSTCLLRFVRPDGSFVTADVRWSRLPGERWLLTARDVTDATRAENLMARLAQLPTSLDGADALFDLAEPVFRALGWTAGFTEIVRGGSITRRVLSAPNDPVGAYGRTIIGRFMSFNETPVLAEVVRTGDPIFLDNLPQAQEGPVNRAVALTESMTAARVIRSAWCPIRSTNAITHHLAVTGPDITEHDFVAIQLFAAQVGAAIRIRALRLEMVRRERLAAVGEMAAVLAHEVRNPLAVMWNALATLDRAGPGDEHWRPLLGMLREEANRLQRLVTDLLEFAGARDPVLESTPLAPLLGDVVHAAKHDTAFERAHPVISLDAPEGLDVLTDGVLLRRALVNVVLNAVQHVQAGGHVNVSASRVDGEVRVRVVNDGEPIGEDVAKRVFEPFFTTKATGTGLGLAIVRRICTDVGARVELVPGEQRPTFEVVLPAAAR
jgi:signal transduction histidine kinase